ncbi:MAG TPA: hypothetical protein VHB99_10205 [Pirellulales bacterium]|nr:hypothetical protein [Pirellulales bacterium]
MGPAASTNGQAVKRVAQYFALLWAAPCSALGLAVAIATLASGGKVRRVGRVLEIYGGAASWLLERMPVGPFAMTLGHTVLGRSGPALDLSRDHELVHVRQYERWGPFFIPAYLLSSLWLWLAGRDAYRENPFEIEAYRAAP